MGFYEWWHETGSGITVDRRDDHEEHAKKVAAKAWDAALEDSTGLRTSDMPPVPKQLLWMFDGIDRKEATKMMHDYAMTAIRNRPTQGEIKELNRLRAEVAAWRERLGDDYEYKPGVPYVVMKTPTFKENDDGYTRHC